jgi:transcriptional regulator of acetoin/glycerol metabolism
LQSLAGKVARAGFFLSVVNREGATTHVGKVPDDGVPRAKIQDGIIWSEGVQGTNAAGTGLFSHRPIIIHRGEHFLAANTAMSCLVSPLYDETGAVLGVLNIATLDKSFDRAMSPFMLTALTAAAQRMEALWFREAFRDFFIVSLPEASGSNGSTPLLAVDAGLNVVGATHAARACYEIDPGAIGSGLSLGQIVTGLPVGAISIRDAERTVLQRALAQTDQNVTLATKQLGISRATMYRKMKSLSVRRKGR